MATESAFNSTSTGPNWKQAVKIWNRMTEYSPNDELAYKVMEHLSTYYSDWKTNIDMRQTLSMSAPVQGPILNQVRDPQRSLLALPVPQQHPALRILTTCSSSRASGLEINCLNLQKRRPESLAAVLNVGENNVTAERSRDYVLIRAEIVDLQHAEVAIPRHL
ncbi:hypothetical protein C8J57DRAFT_1584783 [Mycena rebaudengoi]|nr:hypothetical protein C8J57DRAFT_1584783 [Mycena rebaudengoi]